MQAICKEIRKRAVCGDKPGGHRAYSLKESCVRKEAGKTKPGAAAKKDSKLKSFVEFARLEMQKAMARVAFLQKKPYKAGQVIPTAGTDFAVLREYLHAARAEQPVAISQRVKNAVTRFNNHPRTKKPVVYCRTLEILVLNGAIIHYETILDDLVPIRVVRTTL